METDWSEFCGRGRGPVQHGVGFAVLIIHSELLYVPGDAQKSPYLSAPVCLNGIFQIKRLSLCVCGDLGGNGINQSAVRAAFSG